MLDPCLTPALSAGAPRSVRQAILGSTTGVSGMELGGLEPPTSWVRFWPGGVPRRSVVLRSALAAGFEDSVRAAGSGSVPVVLDSCLIPGYGAREQPAGCS